MKKTIAIVLFLSALSLYAIDSLVTAVTSALGLNWVKGGGELIVRESIKPDSIDRSYTLELARVRPAIEFVTSGPISGEIEVELSSLPEAKMKKASLEWESRFFDVEAGYFKKEFFQVKCRSYFKWYTPFRGELADEAGESGLSGRGTGISISMESEKPFDMGIWAQFFEVGLPENKQAIVGVSLEPVDWAELVSAATYLPDTITVADDRRAFELSAKFKHKPFTLEANYLTSTAVDDTMLDISGFVFSAEGKKDDFTAALSYEQLIVGHGDQRNWSASLSYYPVKNIRIQIGYQNRFRRGREVPKRNRIYVQTHIKI